MEQENRKLLIKYLVCFAIASLIAVAVFWSKGFFTDSLSVNLQILADGFVVAGFAILAFAGMMYISGEGGLLGVSFIIRNVVLAFIPLGRLKHEVYAKYRERKMKEMKQNSNSYALVVGLLFFSVGVLLTVIWYFKFYR